MPKPKLSFVIPAYNEEGNVKPLYHEIKEIVVKLIKDKKISDYEVIFINDGSRDKTQEVLESMKKEEGKKIRIIQFMRNFKKAEAYKAGFELCSGDLIFTMDADLQDNPQDIPRFLEKIEQGYDVVVGWKYIRRDPMYKIMLSRLFNAILRSSTKIMLHDFDNGYRCMKKEVLPHLDLYEGLYRYIPIFAASKGFRVSEIKVHHRPRRSGKSKFGSRLFKGFFDLITIRFLFKYLRRPLHFFGGIGAFSFSIGFLFALYLSILRLALDQTIGNRPLLMLSVLLMIIGIQLLLFGLIGEMIANISKKEKNYVIKKVI